VCRIPTLLAVLVLLLVTADLPAWDSDQRDVVHGPYALLLASSTDLGPAQSNEVQLTAALHEARRPEALIDWAQNNRLSVRWRPGDNWAIIEGAPALVADSFGVPVHDYRGRRGQVFYASPEQPAVPATLRGEISELGRILGYTPHHLAQPPVPTTEPHSSGLTPAELLSSHNASELAAEGFTGKGTTIVFFEFDGFDQDDLDSFTDLSGLPDFRPILIGGQPDTPSGETTMDLEVAHAIAPDARLVVINAVPTLQGDGNFEKIARMFEDADHRFPGAIWSLSIGWACDKLLTAADLTPIRAALAMAQSHGTSAFTATGDNAGLQCKGGDDWASPPGPSDIGLDAISSLPEMTAVGGTALSIDEKGVWLAEQAWFNSPLSPGRRGSAVSRQPATAAHPIDSHPTSRPRQTLSPGHESCSSSRC
jgi:kumamolisin